MPKKAAKVEPKQERANRIPIDIESLKNLRQIAVTEDEAAAVFGVSRRTIIRRLKQPEYRQAWDDGLALCKVGLKRQMIRHSKMANSAGVHATEVLMKHILGWTEKAALEISGRLDSAVEVTTAHERIALKLDTIAERIHGRIAALASATGAGRAFGDHVAGGANGVNVGGGAAGGAIVVK
jgi:hypothetical protein